DLDRLRRRARPAAGEYEDDVELAKRVHPPDEDGEQHDVGQQWHRDVSEALPRGGAIDRGRLEELRREHLEPGVDHEEHERDRAPGIDERDRRQRQAWVDEPWQPAETARAP